MGYFPITDRTHFFRYLNADGALATLETMSWRLTSPGNLNDPDDLVFKKVLPYTANELRRVAHESVARALAERKAPPLLRKTGRMPARLQTDKSPLTYDEWIQELDSDQAFIAEFEAHYYRTTEAMNAELSQAFNDHFLFCLTTDAASERMWDSYGEKGRGAVFRIECLPDEDNVVRIAQPVCYSDDPPPFGTKEEWLNYLEGGPGISVERLYKDVVTWKRNLWSHEKEWRVIFIDKERAGQKHTSFPLRPRELAEVYLGRMMSADHKARISELIGAYYPHTRLIET